ncbi:MAG: hypothetical protein LAP21_09690 [Acidobacteriia bacterium]|nr:hypothetical protein [Terriglobia bacterium]
MSQTSVSHNQEPAGASPAATGPAGPLFEGQVGAYYLLSMLAAGEPRGLPGTTVTRIEFQRASDRPLDDVVVHSTDGQGNQAVLEVQVKRTIDFTASDLVFRAIVAQIAKAAAKPEFDMQRYELAVATERTSTKIERSYQEALAWARGLGTAETFFGRLHQKRLANSDMRKFVENFRANLKLAGASHDDTAVWRILRRFQILVFDFNQAGSATEMLVHERCGRLLAPEEDAKAGAFWQTLVTLTLESASKGGEKKQAQIRDTLVNEYHYRFAGDRQLANARAALQEASFGALQDISSQVGSVRIDRAVHVANVYASLDKGRYVEIRGGSGVGKSAVLKHVAEQISLEARVVILSPARTLPYGWVSLRSTLGCTVSARDFLSDLASDGGAVLFIDGVDIFEDEDKKTTVRDLVRAAALVPNLAVVVTARSDFGKDEPSWLPKEALDALGRAPAVLIDSLSADEIEQLSEGDPSLAFLLADKHPAREVTRNLFRLARLAGSASDTPVPASEAAMAQQWWKTGDGGETGRRERTRLLRMLAEQSLKSYGPFDTRSEPVEAVQSLVMSATLRELKPEKVIFHHDVLHDWALGCLLHDEPVLIDLLPLIRPAPETLVRGAEMAARLAIETSTADTQWAALLDRLSQPGIHGSWRRAVLLALVRSEIGLPILDRASKSLFADKGNLLKELLRITFAVDSESGSKAYASIGIELPSLPADFFIPAAPSWLRLVLWTHMRMKEIPNEGIPDLADFYSRWSMAMFGQDSITPYLLAHFYEWLVEVESALHPDHYTGLRRPFGFAMSLESERELEASLRLNFLAFCRRVPALTEQYLRSVAARRPGDQIADEIMKFRGTAAQAAPAALADLTLRTLIPADDDEDFGASRRNHGPFGIGDTSYFPASPNQGPMLELLTYAPRQGLRVVRELIAHAVRYYAGDRDPGENAIVITFPEGERKFPWMNCYNWSHGGGHSCIATSALMALEAWGHMRIEDGEVPETVLADILGTGTTPTAFLLVAVDVLISHWPKTASAALPLLASPELLSIDRERYAHDIPFFRDSVADEPHGTSSIKSLKSRLSRRMSLDALIGRYVCDESPLLPELRAALSEAAARVGAPGGGDDSMRSSRFAAYHAVNLANSENWKPATLDRGDGTLISILRYQMPAAEEALTAPGQARLAVKNIEQEMHLSLPLALGDNKRSTPEFLSCAATWAESVDLHVKATDEEEDVFQREDWRIRARVSAATLIIRDGDEAMRAQHQPWAQQVITEALAEKNDPYRSHPLLPFNTVAIAAVGHISIVRRTPTEAGLRSLLEISARPDQAMLPAFSAELYTLQEIDVRLPRAVMRIGFASCIHALHDYEESDDANAERVEAHRARVLASIERELAWLRGAATEPEWPAFPNDPPRRKRGMRIGVTAKEWQEERARPKDIVVSSSAAKWIQSALPLLGKDTMDWFRALVDAYAEWTSVEDGAGQDHDIESNSSSLEWNMTYFDLVPRTFVGMTADEIDRGVLLRVLMFPEKSFFDTVAVLIRTLDELYFNSKIIGGDDALRLRTLLFNELRRRRGWQRVVERKSTSMEMHLARAVSSLFLHNEQWGGNKCYLYPAGADSLKVFFPFLSNVCVEAAQSQYIAFQFLNLMELKVDPENLAYLVTTASAWMAKYPDDTSFWIDYSVGKRLCAWLTNAMNAYPDALAAITCPTAEIDRLLDGLLRLGVAAARQVGESFSRIRKNAL